MGYIWRKIWISKEKWNYEQKEQNVFESAHWFSLSIKGAFWEFLTPTWYLFRTFFTSALYFFFLNASRLISDVFRATVFVTFLAFYYFTSDYIWIFECFKFWSISERTQGLVLWYCLWSYDGSSCFEFSLNKSLFSSWIKKANGPCLVSVRCPEDSRLLW